MAQLTEEVGEVARIIAEGMESKVKKRATRKRLGRNLPMLSLLYCVWPIRQVLICKSF